MKTRPLRFPGRSGARLRRLRLVTAVAVLVAACAEKSPTDLVDDPGDDVAVASVAVTSPIGALVAVQGEAQLTAVVTGTDGSTLTRSILWASDEPGIATVSGSGLLTGVSEGSASISATADGIEGTFAVRIVDADMAGIEAVLADPFAEALLAQLNAGPGTPLGDAWSECSTARTEGNLTDLNSCLAAARSGLANQSDPESGPVAGLLDVFVTWLDRLLNL